MQRIEELLQKYRSRLWGAEEQRRHVREAIAAISGITLEERQITFRHGVCMINAHAAAKNEIFLHKQTLLKELKRRGVHIADIR